MINQLYFILSIYVVGFTFSSLLFSGIKIHIRHLASPLMGIAFYSFSVGLLYSFNISISIITLYFVLILQWSTIFFIKRIRDRETDLKTICLDITKNHFTKNALGIFSIYLLLSTIFIFFGSPNVSPDSTQYEGVGRFLAQGGTIKDRVPELAFLINGRFLVVGAMHCINRLFGSYNLYALYPLLTAWCLGFLGILFYSLNKELPKNYKLFLSIIFILTLGLYKNYVYHGIRISSNGLTMMYFSLSILCLYIYTHKENISWVYFGSFLLGVASLVRIDMLIFSSIYFLVQSKIIKNNYLATRNSCIIFLSIALPWRLFTLHLFPSHTWYINQNQVILILFVNVALALFMIISTKLKFSIQWLYKAGYIFIPSLMIIFFIIDSSIIHLGWNLFIKTILFSKIWFSFTFAVTVIIFQLQLL